MRSKGSLFLAFSVFGAAQVMGRMNDVRSFVPGGSRTNSQWQLDQLGTVDRHIFGALQAKGVTPAYSAMGIDWTKQLDTPFGRTFEYVPDASDGLYAPTDELWG